MVQCSHIKCGVTLLSIPTKSSSLIKGFFYFCLRKIDFLKWFPSKCSFQHTAIFREYQWSNEAQASVGVAALMLGGGGGVVCFAVFIHTVQTLQPLTGLIQDCVFKAFFLKKIIFYTKSNLLPCSSYSYYIIEHYFTMPFFCLCYARDEYETFRISASIS